jgi:4-hydroxy-3-methylbut-2-enyl diphosphate reductase
VGTIAVAPESIRLVEPEVGLPGVPAAGPVALLAQTTLGMHEWADVLDQARAGRPDVATARKSDLCYATTNRQEAVGVLAAKCDVVLVVGSENSSNTQALVRTCRQLGTPAYRVDAASQVRAEWLEGVATVGVTAGASAPDHLVREVIDRLAPAAGVELVSTITEGEYFPLPPQLRAMVGVLQALVEAGVTARPPRAGGRLDHDRDWTASEALLVLTS